MDHLKEYFQAGGRVEGVDIAENSIVVVTSELGGNVWDASLRVIDSSTKELIASLKQECGCAAVCWSGVGQRAICAQDSGDVKV